MKYLKGFIFFLFIFSPYALVSQGFHYQINTSAVNSVIKDIELPEGYTRIEYDSGSFAFYVQHLPIKRIGEPVMYYNGRIKSNSFHYAVLDVSVGNKDLQQCADALIRIRTEYLYANRRFDEINFYFTNGFRAEFSKWCQGYRIKVNGNDVSWYKTSINSDDYDTLIEFMEKVFTYAGSLSLSKELIFTDLSTIRPGDVFIHGGSPGHAMLVVDVAKNNNTGEKVFLLAQSFMPAQNIHIVINPDNEKLSPWYSINFGKKLDTPEWIFFNSEFMSFE